MEQIANEVHKPAYKPKKYRKVISDYVNDVWSADLVEMQTFQKDNDGYKYILNMIDIYSRYAWSRPLKTKTGKSVAEAIKSIVDEVNVKPQHLWIDEGKEFLNKDVRKVLDGVNFYSTYSNNKASVVERFNRTMKAIMYKLFTVNQNRKWINILQPIIDKYNNRKHSSIGFKPKQVYFNNITMPSEIETNDKKPKFKVGDRVRISYALRPSFDKSYLPLWSWQLYTVSKVIKSNPYTYKISDYTGKEIEGSFYSEELQKTDQKEDVYLVEKILRRKTIKGKKHVLVKWLGYPSEASTWELESNVKDFDLLN